mgnify:CR=1 FL=1
MFFRKTDEPACPRIEIPVLVGITEKIFIFSWMEESETVD